MHSRTGFIDGIFVDLVRKPNFGEHRSKCAHSGQCKDKRIVFGVFVKIGVSILNLFFL